MVELQKPGFDTAAFLASAGLGRRIIRLAPQDAFFSRGIPQTRFFIFRKAAQKSPLFPPPGRKLPSRFSPPGTLWEKRRSRQWLGCVWPQPLQLPPAPLSESAVKR